MVECIRWHGHHAILNPSSTTGGVLQAELVLTYKAGWQGSANQVPEAHPGMTEQLSMLAALSKFRRFWTSALTFPQYMFIGLTGSPMPNVHFRTSAEDGHCELTR